jgi:NDP-sugar pyrophosphorylase family protein
MIEMIDRAYILCGGLGTRLLSVVSDLPKCMASVDGKPFLEYLIRWLRKYRVERIVLCVGYRRELIEETFRDGGALGVQVTYAIEEELLGTGGALKNAVRRPDGTCLVMNGDSFVNIDLERMMDQHEQAQSAATIALSRVMTNGDYGTVRFDRDFRITSFVEKAQGGAGPGWVNAGVYLFEPEVFEQIPAHQKVSLEYEVFPRLIETGTRVHGYLTEERLMDIGTPERYHLAQAFFRGMQL